MKFLEARGVLDISLNTGIIKVNHNKCSHVILSAIAPFLCVYYQLAVTLNQMVSENLINATNFPLNILLQFPADSLEEFPIKNILITMQQRIETILHTNNSQLLHVHPYCLALDNLNIAIHALAQGSYLERNRETGNFRHSSQRSLLDLEQLLLQYCNLMPFKQYYYCNNITSKL